MVESQGLLSQAGLGCWGCSLRGFLVSGQHDPGLSSVSSRASLSRFPGAGVLAARAQAMGEGRIQFQTLRKP